MVGSPVRVGTGGRERSGLRKVCLRVRAFRDVTPVNTVCYLVPEGEHINDNVSFLWSCGKCVIRDGEGSGDTHNKLPCVTQGRKDGEGATV